MEPLRFDDDVVEDLLARHVGQLAGPGQDLRPRIDGRDRGAQLVGQDPDEGVADGLLLALLGDVAQEHDRLVLVTGHAIATGGDGPGADLDPALVVGADPQLDRPAAPAERRREPVGVVELGEDLRVGRLVDVGEDILGGRVGEDDPAGPIADDDAVAHRPDHRIELGRPGVLGRREPAQALLGVDPIADVARDRQDPGRCAVRRDVLEADLDRQDRPARANQLDGHRAGVRDAAGQVVHRVGEGGATGRVEVLADQRADEIVDRALELLRGAAVCVGDPAGQRLEHQDRVAGRVEQALEPDALAEQAGVLDRRGRPTGEALGECDVVRLEAPAAVAADQGQDADDPAAGDQRDRDVGAERQRPEHLAMAVVAGRRVDHPGRDVGHVLRAPGPQDRRHAARRVGIGRVRLLRLDRERHEARVAMSDRDPARDALLARELDDAPVGEHRDGEIGDGLDRALVVERRPEDLGRPGQEALALLGPDPIGHVGVGDDRRFDAPAGARDRGGAQAERPARFARVDDLDDLVLDRLAGHRPAQRPFVRRDLRAIGSIAAGPTVGWHVPELDRYRREAPRRLVGVQEPPVGDSRQDHADRHLAEDRFEPCPLRLVGGQQQLADRAEPEPDDRPRREVGVGADEALVGRGEGPPLAEAEPERTERPLVDDERHGRARGARTSITRAQTALAALGAVDPDRADLARGRRQGVFGVQRHGFRGLGEGLLVARPDHEVEPRRRLIEQAHHHGTGPERPPRLVGHDRHDVLDRRCVGQGPRDRLEALHPVGELLRGAPRPLLGLVRADIADREPDARRDLEARAHGLGLERALTDGREHDRADDLAARGQRLGDGAPDARRLEQPPEVGIRRRLVRPPGRDVEGDDRVAGGDRLPARAAWIGDRRVVPERLDERPQLGVAGRDRGAPDCPIGLDEVRCRLDDGGDVGRLVQAQRGVGKHPGDLLGAAALLGELLGAALAVPDPLLGLDPGRDVVERVDRHHPPVGQGGPPGEEHRPAVGRGTLEAEADEHRLDRLAREDPATREPRAIERPAVLVDHREAVHEIARGCLEHLARRAEADETGRLLIDEQQSAALILDRDPGRDPLEDRPQVSRQGVALHERACRDGLVRSHVVLGDVQGFLVHPVPRLARLTAGRSSPLQ